MAKNSQRQKKKKIEYIKAQKELKIGERFACKELKNGNSEGFSWGYDVNVVDYSRINKIQYDYIYLI